MNSHHRVKLGLNQKKFSVPQLAYGKTIILSTENVKKKSSPGPSCGVVANAHQIANDNMIVLSTTVYVKQISFGAQVMSI